ncbi:MAG: hypothetical protein ACPL06_02280 [Candidatus Anstonellales archaeon]
MKKLMFATITALSLLTPNKLNSESKEKEPEVKVFFDPETGETLRVRVLDPSYWSWLDTLLSEELDSSAAVIERKKIFSDTLYRPNFYRTGTGAPEKIEIVYSQEVRELLRKLGYAGEETWGEVGKKIITAWKKEDDYDTSEVITFPLAMKGSAICLPYSVVMYTLMVNEGFDPYMIELQKGWFKESGPKDSALITRRSFSGHVFVYLNGIVYDNNTAYPAGEGDERGFNCAYEYSKNLTPVPSPPEVLETGWKPAVFLINISKKPWDYGHAYIHEGHVLYPFYSGENMWVVSGFEEMSLGSYCIVYSPELRQVVREMSSSQE